MIGYIIAGVIIILLVVLIISKYNKLVRLKNKVQNAFAQIEAHLQRRFDLIPNLIETIKGYQIHEKELLENITAYRSGYLAATTNGEKLEANNMLTNSLRTLNAVAENYPDLKSNSNFLMLQQELSETEDKLVYARQFYNDAVTIYNSELQVFPNNFIASMFNFSEEALFKADQGAAKAPTVKF
jgi:LemA protein